jgi:hypothetical protein
MKCFGYWNIKENVLNEARKYSSRSEFNKKNKHAYDIARKNNWLNEVFKQSNANALRHPLCYWFNKENVFTESKKYTSKNEFKKHCDRAYTVARKNGWLDEMIWLLPKDNAYSSSNCVYAYVDNEYNVAYVGLTCDKERRHHEHTSSLYNGNKIKSAVYSFFHSINKEIPNPIYLEENLSRTESQIKEKEWLDKYVSMGYKMLNKGKTGLGISCLGRTSKWTKEQFLNEARKFSTTTEFHKNSSTAYEVGREKGWLKYTDLIDTSSIKYLTYEECLTKLELYTSITDIIKKEHILYSSLKHNNLFSYAKYFFEIKTKNKYKEKVFNISKEYKILSDFRKNNYTYYLISKKRGWLSEMYWITNDVKSPTIDEIKEKVFEKSKNFQYVNDFRVHCKSAYKVAKDNGWISEMSWLGYRPRSGGKNEKLLRIWTFDKVLKEVENNKYTKKEFRASNKKAYVAAWRNKWLDNLPFVKEKKMSYSIDEIKDIAKTYKRRSDFSNGNHKAYTIAAANNLLDKLFPKYVSKKQLS